MADGTKLREAKPLLIKSVKIENFKQFKDPESINIQSLDCVVGPNNSGKTTLLQALALFDFCLHYSLGGKNGNIEFRRRTINPEEFYVLPISNPTDLWTDRRTQTTGNKHIIIRISVSFEERPDVTATVELNFNRLTVAIECKDTSSDWLNQLRDFRISYLPVFSAFLAEEERRTSAAINDDLARGQVSRVIRNLLLNLKNENRAEELVQILQRSFPSLTDMNIEFDDLNDRYISVTYREKSHSKEFDIFSAGSGFQQFVYLFGFILLRQPTVILLDEPDVHLHATLQKALLEELHRFVAEGKQVLFATHSSDMIKQMNVENILSLEHGIAKRLIVPFDVFATLEHLGSVDNTQLIIMQAYKRVLVVENEIDWKLLSIFCSKCLPLIWSQVERRLAICYTRGNPRNRDMSWLQDKLQQMIPEHKEALEMFVIGDRDYYPDLAALYKVLPTKHLKWHIWERTEIENYLLSESGLLRMIDDSSEPAFKKTFDQQFVQLLEASRNAANDHLVQGFEEYSKKEKNGWNAVKYSQEAREYLEQHWDNEKLALAEAKTVLSGIKGWLQQAQHRKAFSNEALAEQLNSGDLPTEVHKLAEEIAFFAGVQITN